jgi:predicted glycosyltransferase
MKVAVTVQHPAHVHFFDSVAADLEAAGHETRVYAREKGVVADLLARSDVAHELLAGEAGSIPTLAAVQSLYELRLLRRIRRFEPDVVTAIGGVAAAHVSTLLDTPSVVFYDTEHAALVTRLAYPFADVVCTPLAYREPVPGTHRRYPGCHELAYLHPDRFSPDPAAVEGLGFDPAERFAVLRASDWSASHDVAAGGFRDLVAAVERLEAAGARVVLLPEGDPPAAIADRQREVPPDAVHDLLAHADLYVGEGATMAAESGVLGTPAVYVNSLSMGYTDWLEHHGLLFGYHGDDRHERGLDRAEALLKSDVDWQRRRDRLLARATDTASVAVAELKRAAAG